MQRSPTVFSSLTHSLQFPHPQSSVPSPTVFSSLTHSLQFPHPQSSVPSPTVFSSLTHSLQFPHPQSSVPTPRPGTRPDHPAHRLRALPVDIALVRAGLQCQPLGTWLATASRPSTGAAPVFLTRSRIQTKRSFQGCHGPANAGPACAQVLGCTIRSGRLREGLIKLRVP